MQFHSPLYFLLYYTRIVYYMLKFTPIRHLLTLFAMFFFTRGDLMLYN